MLALCLFASVDAGRVKPNDGSVWLLGRQDVTVLEAPPRGDGSANLLRPGDVILGIDHTLVNSPQDAARILSRQAVGSEVIYLVDRDGRPLELPIVLTGFRAADNFYAYYAVMAVVYWVIGLMVYLRGRDLLSARLFFRLCLLFAVFFMTNLNRSSYFWGDIITQNAGALARFLLPAIFLHFFLVFPEKKYHVARHPWLEPALYVLPAVFYVQFTLDQFFGAHAPRIYNTRWLILGLYFTAGVLALLHSYVQLRDPLQRQRLRIITLGTLVGVVPFLILTVLPGERFGATVAFAGIAPMITVPVSFGYGIVRYRVIDIEVLLRRSFLYTFLSVGLFIVYLGLVLGLGAAVLRLSGQTSQIATAAAILLAAAVLWPARVHLQGQLDSRFFRSRGNLAVAMREFSQDIPRLIQFDQLVDRIGTRLCALLDLPKVAVYRPEQEDGRTVWRLAGAARLELPPAAATAADHLPPCPERIDLEATAKRLEQFNEPYWIERSGSRLSLRAAATREQAELLKRLQERDDLARAGLALLVPMLAQGRLVGVFALPPKRGDDDFQIQDLELLSMVAGQMALQMENSRLYDEELKKQKLEEQLALARSIQSRLLPARIPSIGGLDLAAVNITSAEVSGDYYDLFLRDDGRLVIIISDVCGKGIPASLLASSLQAALRAHCQGGEPLARIMERVNLYLHENTEPSHFATLFLALYDPADRSLRYSSGGHNAPILRRADGRCELLEKGGLPIGAFDFSEYEEGLVRCEPGDVVFLYTDGLTESLSPDGEEFGTDRVEALLRDGRELSAEELLRTMHRELVLFCKRPDADDDVTLVSLKILDAAADGAGRREDALAGNLEAGSA
ncbi:MAG TPA: SpoIIE family protein phosphatase [Candidatus Krumholzibacteria bacterium]|nr:SpoIIE family protein phosphatase [Candidatus Krumholzibacteria bacterium]